MQPNATLRRLVQPDVILLAAAVVLPLLLFGLAAWENHNSVLREAEIRAQRTVRILEEHAQKVFETQRLIIEQIKDRVTTIDWAREDEKAALHDLMARLQAKSEQFTTITITDANGRMRANGRLYPADPTIDFTDREWFQAFKQSDQDRPFVSRPFVGRVTGHRVFSIAEQSPRFRSKGFDGAIVATVDQAYFEAFYRDVEPEFDHSVTLVRDDGVILAREPRTEQTSLASSQDMLKQMQSGREGSYVGVSPLDGVERIYAYRRIGDYPVYVRFGVSTRAALKPWFGNLISYGLVCMTALLALVAASALAVRQTAREATARRSSARAVAELQIEVTERGRVEDQLRQAQKMEAVGQLTGGLAHDFNNLLTCITGSLELLQRRVRHGRFDDVDRYVTTAQDAAERAAALTHRLLAFSRRQTLEPKPTDIDRLVAGMRELLQRTVGPEITIEIVVPDGFRRTLVDPGQLENALLNLCINARDAMPGGGRLTIRTGDRVLDERAPEERDLQAGQYVWLEVSDSGTGMPPDIVARAFDPFFTTKPIGMGTGLGLSMVYGFANQSGGQARITSLEGEGTTVRLYLPRHIGEETVVKAPTSPTDLPQAPAGKTVLVVDDEATVLMLVTEVLEDLGYTTVEAPDGAAALKILQTDLRIDLLVTDVGLPGGLNGRQVADAARAGRPGLKVLFITGYAENAALGEGQLEPGMSVLTKPFAIEAFATRVNTLMTVMTR